jgi:hypothetical protein
MSSATLRVVRLKLANIGEVSAPDGSCTTGSPGADSRRRLSGRAGDSILITSAPSSARAVPLSAPAIAVPNEITRTPLSGPGTGSMTAGSRHWRAISATELSPSGGAGRRYWSSTCSVQRNGSPGRSNSPRPASSRRTKNPRLRGCGSSTKSPAVLTTVQGRPSCWPRTKKSSLLMAAISGRMTSMILSSYGWRAFGWAHDGSDSSAGWPSSSMSASQCLSVDAVNSITPSRHGQEPPPEYCAACGRRRPIRAALV